MRSLSSLSALSPPSKKSRYAARDRIKTDDCFWLFKLLLLACCRRYGTKCGGCLQGISPQDLVRKARDKVFHLNCFTCLVCRKQMSTGEELYVLDDNKFVCKQDYLSGKPLPDTHHVHGHHGELQVSLSLVSHRGE